MYNITIFLTNKHSTQGGKNYAKTECSNSKTPTFRRNTAK